MFMWCVCDCVLPWILSWHIVCTHKVPNLEVWLTRYECTYGKNKWVLWPFCTASSCEREDNQCIGCCAGYLSVYPPHRLWFRRHHPGTPVELISTTLPQRNWIPQPSTSTHVILCTSGPSITSWTLHFEKMMERGWKIKVVFHSAKSWGQLKRHVRVTAKGRNV